MPICGYVSYFPNGMINSISVLSVHHDDDDLVVSHDFWSTQTLTLLQWAHKAMLPGVQSADGWVGLLSHQVRWVGSCCVLLRHCRISSSACYRDTGSCPRHTLLLGFHVTFFCLDPLMSFLVIKWDPVRCLSWSLCSSLQIVAVGLPVQAFMGVLASPVLHRCP